MLSSSIWPTRLCCRLQSLVHPTLYGRNSSSTAEHSWFKLVRNRLIAAIGVERPLISSYSIVGHWKYRLWRSLKPVRTPLIDVQSLSKVSFSSCLLSAAQVNKNHKNLFIKWVSMVNWISLLVFLHQIYGFHLAVRNKDLLLHEKGLFLLHC